jgi:hypothetical protein
VREGGATVISLPTPLTSKFSLFQNSCPGGLNREPCLLCIASSNSNPLANHFEPYLDGVLQPLMSIGPGLVIRNDTKSDSEAEVHF